MLALATPDASGILPRETARDGSLMQDGATRCGRSASPCGRAREILKAPNGVTT